MEDLEAFVQNIDGFTELSSAEKIEFFAYFIININKSEYFQAKDITLCFEELNLKPYSNISQLLSSKTKGKNHTYLKKKIGYVIERKTLDRIGEKIGLKKLAKPSNDYIPLSLFLNTRGYIEKIASQAILCYDYSLFDGCFVMTRKLLETLIIELFERKGVDSKIKNSQNQYFYLSDLLGVFLSESKWTLSRNTHQGIGTIKKIVDLSAHNRRFCATKIDVDKIKLDLRIVLEELIHLIDYPNWK